MLTSRGLRVTWSRTCVENIPTIQIAHYQLTLEILTLNVILYALF